MAFRGGQALKETLGNTTVSEGLRITQTKVHSMITGEGAANEVRSLGNQMTRSVEAEVPSLSSAPVEEPGLGDRRAYLNEKFGRTGNLDQDISFRGYLEKARSLDVSTEGNKAVFWSGYPENLNRARKFTQETGKTILETTQGGKYLSSEQLYLRLDKTLADAVWQNLSRRYAMEASGEVTAFTFNGNPVGVGTFWNVELPALMKNPRVSGMVFK